MRISGENLMKRYQRRKRHDPEKGNPAGRVLSITGTGMIILVIILCSFLVLPGIFGFRMYHVLSGSMEPAVRVGSLIYVREGAPEDVEQEDIIAFYGQQDSAGSGDEGGIITHRVVKNNVVSGIFRTKGDANDSEDPMPVPYASYIGKVILVIPYMGRILTIMTSLYGKISAAFVIVLGAVLNMAGIKLSKMNVL